MGLVSARVEYAPWTARGDRTLAGTANRDWGTRARLCGAIKYNLCSAQVQLIYLAWLIFLVQSWTKS